MGWGVGGVGWDGEGSKIWLKHFVTELLVTLRQQTPTSCQDRLRNRLCDSTKGTEIKEGATEKEAEIII